MKVDRSAGLTSGAAPSFSDPETARLIDAKGAAVRIDHPVLGRVIEAGKGRCVIDLDGERLALETSLPLKLRQRVELRPAPPVVPGEGPRVEVRAVPIGSLVVFANPMARHPGGSGSRAAGLPPSPVATTGSWPSRAPEAFRGAPIDSLSLPRPALDLSALEPALPVPRRESQINLRELPTLLSRPRPLRLPVLEVESPSFEPGEDAVLRVVETAGRHAMGELKGIRVVLESEHSLRPGLEFLCRALPSHRALSLEALGILSAPRPAPSECVSGRAEPPLPFRIEVRESRLPEFPPDIEIAANVHRVDARGAVMSLGPVQVRIENSAGWQPGVQLHVRVLQGGPQPVLEVTPSDSNPAFEPMPEAEARVGAELIATVQRRIAAERYLIELGSRTFEAATRTPLESGTRLSVRVERAGRLPRLAILEELPSIEAVAKQTLRARIPALPPFDSVLKALLKEIHSLSEAPASELPPRFHRVLAGLQDFLKSAAPVPPYAEWLQKLVRMGGLRFEKGLAESIEDPAGFRQTASRDFKGLLLQIAAADTARHPRLVELRQAAEQALGHLEGEQAANLIRSVSSEGIRLLLPLIDAGQITATRVEIHRDKGDRRSGRPQRPGGTNLLFLLELEGLGKTQINAHVGPDGLQAHFFVEGTDALPVLKDGLPGLARTLKRAGFASVRLEAFPLEERPLPEVDESEAMGTSEDASELIRLLNLRA